MSKPVQYIHLGDYFFISNAVVVAVLNNKTTLLKYIDFIGHAEIPLKILYSNKSTKCICPHYVNTLFDLQLQKGTIN